MSRTINDRISRIDADKADAYRRRILGWRLVRRQRARAYEAKVRAEIAGRPAYSKADDTAGFTCLYG